MTFEIPAIRASVLALLIVAALVGVSLWRAHLRKDLDFNLFDLLMENGRVSKIAVAFMLVLGVSTWVIVHLTINGKLTEGYFTIYTGAWIAPLVAKVVFNKSEAPSTSAAPLKEAA
jgi:hypothetical protein